MRSLIRIFMLSLALLTAGVGMARGQYGGDYFDGKIKWSYFMVEIDKTCTIWPADKSVIKGAVKIPSEVVTNGGAKLRVVEIAKSAFDFCNAMTSVVIPESVTRIDTLAFAFCKGLTEVTIPNLVQEIASMAFFGCTRLREVKLGSELEMIGSSAFNLCPGLEGFTVNRSNATFYTLNGVLLNRKKNSLVRCPAGIAGSYAIPTNVEEVEKDAFSDCGKLTEIFIPSTVNKIGDGAFTGCIALQKFKVSADNKYYCAKDGVLFNIQMTELLRCPGGFKGEYHVPYGVTSIGTSAFFHCEGLTRVEIPNGAVVGAYAFEACKQLDNVVFPRNVSVIKEGTFIECSGLTKVEIPVTVKVIGPSAFERCTKLQSVSIPRSVVAVDWNAFYNCSSLSKVYWMPEITCKVSDYAFGKINSSATLYVPLGEKDAIVSGEGKWWKAFANIKSQCLVEFLDYYGRLMSSSLVAFGERVTPPKLYAPAGKSYEWVVDGVKFDFSKGVNSNLKITARLFDAKTAVESLLLAQVQLMGNPVGTTLRFTGLQPAERVEIFSLRGELVASLALTGAESVAIDASSWASGLYVARIAARDGVKTLRFVKL